MKWNEEMNEKMDEKYIKQMLKRVVCSNEWYVIGLSLFQYLAILIYSDWLKILLN